jgi:hypothetical protein
MTSSPSSKPQLPGFTLNQRDKFGAASVIGLAVPDPLNRARAMSYGLIDSGISLVSSSIQPTSRLVVAEVTKRPAS